MIISDSYRTKHSGGTLTTAVLRYFTLDRTHIARLRGGLLKGKGRRRSHEHPKSHFPRPLPPMHAFALKLQTYSLVIDTLSWIDNQNSGSYGPSLPSTPRTASGNDTLCTRCLSSLEINSKHRPGIYATLYSCRAGNRNSQRPFQRDCLKWNRVHFFANRLWISAASLLGLRRSVLFTVWSAHCITHYSCCGALR